MPWVVTQPTYGKFENERRVIDAAADQSDEVFMDVVDLAPGVSPDGRAIIFRMSGLKRDVECAITREALEECFWLPTGADGARMLKTFADGRQRIIAAAERKLRARPDQSVQLTIADFLAKR